MTVDDRQAHQAKAKMLARELEILFCSLAEGQRPTDDQFDEIIGLLNLFHGTAQQMDDSSHLCQAIVQIKNHIVNLANQDLDFELLLEILGILNLAITKERCSEMMVELDQKFRMLSITKAS